MTASMDVILKERSVILRTICPSKKTLTMFPALLVFALVFCTVRPSFNTKPFLFVINPLTLVLRSIFVVVGSESVSLVISPLPIVNVAVDVCKLAFAMGTIDKPLTLILCPIWPDLVTTTTLCVPIPLTGVYHPIIKCVRRPCFKLHILELLVAVGRNSKYHGFVFNLLPWFVRWIARTSTHCAHGSKGILTKRK